MDIPNHLLPTRLQLGNGYAHADYFLVTLPGVEPAHVLDPGFWVHQAARLRLHDRIEVVAADGSFDLDLRVVAVDPHGHYARVRVLRAIDADGRALAIESRDRTVAETADADGYVIQHDPVQQWRILRGRDLIERDLPSEAAAKARLAEVKGARGRRAA